MAFSFTLILNTLYVQLNICTGLSQIVRLQSTDRNETAHNDGPLTTNSTSTNFIPKIRTSGIHTSGDRTKGQLNSE
jgi:hypothetical protein